MCHRVNESARRTVPPAIMFALTLATIGLVDPRPANAADEGKNTTNGIWIHANVEDLPGLPMGPFVRLPDGGILTVDTGQSAMLSTDEGKSWTNSPIFADAGRYAIRPERALLCTRKGTVIVAFMNDREKSGWKWDPKISDAPDAKLPTCVVRSPDGGKTWESPQKLHDDWTGAIRDMNQTAQGTVVFTSMMLRHNPGRHTVVTYASADEGATWQRSNVIDLGGVGHHGGVTEATIQPLKDGRIWLLMRTNWKTFWEAYSDDEGLNWKSTAATKIDASSAPGLLERLHSGRLVLVWNRYFPEGKDTFPLSGGDNQWSEVPVSNHRLELSIAFSEDEGKTWTKPVVIARNERGWLAYPYLFEAQPGELWITTMQGGLRIKVQEDDFLPRRRSDDTYPARWLPAAKIELDGRADEADWALAKAENRFVFPWKDTPAPPTEFRALCTEQFLYFTFRITDTDIVVLDTLRDEEDAVFEDRAEMYFCRDEQMRDYYCIEVDSRGRAFDYRAAYYRQLDPKWNWPGLETKGSPLENGYVVEGRIPLASFAAMGFPALRPGVKIRCGLFRAEFSHDRSGKPVVYRESIHNRGRRLDGPPPIEEWMAWVDPKTEEPDFHVPTSLGWLEIVP